MLKTNSKKYLQNMQNFVISAISEDCPSQADADKLKYLFDCYDSEFNHKFNAQRFPNEQERFANWLAGLPSAISLPCYYSDIIELAKELQEVDEYDTKTENRICENYFNFMAFHIIKINNNLNK